MTNNQQESRVRDWLIEHYTNNDVRLSQQAKEEMLTEHPELTSEENPDRIKIEALCQKESLLNWERRYFNLPFDLPTSENALVERPLRYHYQDLISLIGTEIAGRNAKIENNEHMQEIWGKSLVVALLVKPADSYYSIFYPSEGMQRLEVIYHRFKLGCGWSEGKLPERLDLQFMVKYSDLELEYFRGVHDSAVPRVPDAKQKAEEYLKSNAKYLKLNDPKPS